MSDLAERIRALVDEWRKSVSNTRTNRIERAIIMLCIDNAPTILAGLAALELNPSATLAAKDAEIARLREDVERLEADLSECRTYHAPRIAELERLGLESQNRIGDLVVLVGNLEQCRCVEGDSITILCDNPEADSAELQAAVEACGDYTGYELQRFYGKTWEEALTKAANAARAHYRDNDDYE